jgi:Protein of unknown function (DUF3551)
MRAVIALTSTLLAALLLSATEPAQAIHNAHWCLVGGSGDKHCSYNTLAQCNASRTGAGGHCVRNPRR